jgi:hypothetical protein
MNPNRNALSQVSPQSLSRLHRSDALQPAAHASDLVQENFKCFTMASAPSHSCAREIQTPCVTSSPRKTLNVSPMDFDHEVKPNSTLLATSVNDEQ